MWITRGRLIIPLVTMSSTLGCQLTMTELKALNPRAATLVVSCRPSEIPGNVKIMALQSMTGHIVTDEQQDELMSVAPLASVFIEFNDAAPPENVAIMASDYGLSCPDHLRRPAPPSEASADSARLAARYVGLPANTPASSGTTSLPRIGVCARPKGIVANEWHGGPGIKGVSTTSDADAYAKQTAKATVLFYYDAKAPPESVWHFGKDTKVRCPGKAPIPYDQWVAQNSGMASQPSGSTNSATPAPPASTTMPSATTTTTTTRKKGDGKTTETSSSEGQGPPLSTLEAIARNLALAGALSQGDTSGNPKDPNGSRHGIPGGKNVGGFSFPPLQAGVALLQILTSAGLSPKSFVENVVKFAKRGQRTLIKEADAKMMKVADELIQNAGQYEMAKGLQEMQTIMPFELGQKFTKDLAGKFQAHKIFERRAIKKFMEEAAEKANQKLSNEALEKAVDEAAKKYPAIILTKEEHDIISNALNAAWAKVGAEKMTKEQLRKIYKDVYVDNPHWLEAIESYLR